MKYRVYDIKWDTDNEIVDLPNETIIDSADLYVDVDDELAEELSDYISGTFGYCHKGFSYEPYVAPYVEEVKKVWTVIIQESNFECDLFETDITIFDTVEKAKAFLEITFAEDIYECEVDEENINEDREFLKEWTVGYRNVRYYIEENIIR